MKTELERYKEALSVADAFICVMKKSVMLSSDRRTELALETQGRIATILNPPPEMEEVQEVAWKDKETGLLHGVLPIGFEETGRFVKLTGTYKRPVPQPVERTVTAEVSWLECRGFTYPVANAGTIDWESLVGKKGVMTFTPTEALE